jgi:poly(A) polymerase
LSVNCKQPWMQSTEIKSIFAALDNKARLVGGCVRDALLSKAVKDIDIATTHLPQDTLKLLEKKHIRSIPTGIEHGTITAVIKGQNFEITTLRSDIECYGRHATVAFTDDWQQDAARRDFTINAMSCDLNGNLYDYFGGYDDLNAGLVRFVGDASERCREDILRILRFFRFNAWYGKGALSKDGITACANFAPQINNLSGERVQAEMLKLLAAPNPSKIIKTMQDKDITSHLFPLTINLKALESLINIEPKAQIEINPLLRLSSLLINATLTNEIFNDFANRWKLSNKDKDYLYQLLFTYSNFYPQMPLAEQRKLTRKAGTEIFIDVVALEFSVCGGDEFIDIINKARQWPIPQFPISGKDLLAIGMKPGPMMGEALKQAEEWWESGGYKASAQEILEYIKKTGTKS